MPGEEESKLFQYGGRSLQRGRHVVSKSDIIKLSEGQHCFPLVTGAGKIEAYTFQMRKSRKVSAILGTTGQSGSVLLRYQKHPCLTHSSEAGWVTLLWPLSLWEACLSPETFSVPDTMPLVKYLALLCSPRDESLGVRRPRPDPLCHCWHLKNSVFFLSPLGLSDCMALSSYFFPHPCSVKGQGSVFGLLKMCFPHS